MTLKFMNGERSGATAVMKGVYVVDLPAGVWSLCVADGNVCATGLQVAAGAWQNVDLVYPLGGCQDLRPRPLPLKP